MRCRRIQDLLKSGYPDGELKEGLRLDVQRHLQECGACRQMEEELKALREPLLNAQRFKTPDEVWENIRRSIIKEGLQEKSGVFARLLFIRRPAFATATLFATLVFALIFGRMAFQVRHRAGALDAMESVLSYSFNGASDEISYDLGTGVEEYFL